MKKLFGTDGIRGLANTPPMTGATALHVGRAVAEYFGEQQRCSKVIIGQDTRISGDMFAEAIAAGVCAAGLDVLKAGVVPTPAIAYLAKQDPSAVGIVVSASHNPWYDNGIKVFNHAGRKLSESVEADIEHRIAQLAGSPEKEGPRKTGRVAPLPEAGRTYIDFLCKCAAVPDLLKDLPVVIDCAHGAASEIAPVVFKRLGADLTVLNAAPDGTNINAGCGSEHTGGLVQALCQKNAAVGLAFDGDADRLIAVDETGREISGDQLIAICAIDYKQAGRLDNNRVVTTVMSNIGLVRTLEQHDVIHSVSDVGDRYVMEKMVEDSAVIGGENSGHMIFRDQHSTGDGILSALKVLAAMQRQAKTFSELAGVMQVYPQELLAVEVTAKPELESLTDVARAIADVEARLGDQGRVLVRYSGTQPVCRVMVEGPDEQVTAAYCQEIAETVRDSIGSCDPGQRVL